MTSPRSKADALPNANNPRLLLRLIGLVAGGVRRAPALAEVLEVEPRTVLYYLQAAEWLGLLSVEAEPRLSRWGLELAYAAPNRRWGLYAEAVRRNSVAAELIAEGPPTVEAALALVQRLDPELAESTARRRASALVSLVAPATRPTRKPGPPAVQLELPFPSADPDAEGPLPVNLAAGPEHNPDLYARLLDALLDQGELANHHLRALLDEAGAGESGLGSYAEMAGLRGDAQRIGDRLVATPGAASRRLVAGDGLLVALSEPIYRARLEALAANQPTLPAPAWVRAWDLRVFGQPLSAANVGEALAELIVGASLRQLPRAGVAGPALPLTDAPFLEVLDTPGLPLAMPGSLRELSGGLPAANTLLRRLKQSPLAVRPPDALSPRIRVHGGLLHPGEALPSVIPDQFSLRQRALGCCPALGMLGGLLTLARRPEAQLRVERHPAGPLVRLRARPLGSLSAVFADFCDAQGWLLFRRPGRSLTSGELERVSRALGISVRVGRLVLLEENLFARLQEDPEAAPVYEGLCALADRFAIWLESAAEAARP